MANYDTTAYGYMQAVVQAKETYESAQKAGAATADLLRLTAAASAGREWLNGHGYGWAASALGYSTATAAQAKVWLATVGKPRLIVEYYSRGSGAYGGQDEGLGGNQDPGVVVPVAPPGYNPTTGKEQTAGLPAFSTVVWGVIIVGGLLAVKSLFGGR